jgi:hypothetical protein
MGTDSFPTLAASNVTLDSIELRADDWTPVESNAGMKSWKNEVGDLLTIHYFQARPDLGARLGDVAALRSFFRTMVLKNGGGIISVDVLELGGLPAVRAVVKVPQTPKGTTYLASLTIPRRDFSFVVKVQCQEVGEVGARDHALFGRFVASQQRLSSWELDPYDGSRRDKIMRNRGEAEEYDVQFPDHPLSRARRYLGLIEATIHVHQEVARAPAFFGPD